MARISSGCYRDPSMSDKYPRSAHLPWSPGGTSDDKRMVAVSGLIGVELVITEKCDGSNLTYTREHVFARSHGGPPAHPSFALAKATQATLASHLAEGISVFCEYCYAVHSIEYHSLPGYSLVFGVRSDALDLWWDWDRVTALASELSLPTVPVLFRGSVKTKRELQRLTNALAQEPSSFGGPREGVVVRTAAAFPNAEFRRCLGKWVRQDHVQTDEHWQSQTIRVQPLGTRDAPPSPPR